MTRSRSERESPSFATWVREIRRRFSALDVLILILGGVLGAGGNALFAKDLPIATGMLVVAALAVVSAVAIDRFRSDSEAALHSTYLDVKKQLGDLKSQIDDHHSELREQLDTHLDYVHATVSFVENVPSRNGARNTAKRAGYDVATAAVRRARRSILVIGDYSPPPEEGPGLGPEPPVNRSQYLAAIEAMLEERLNSRDPSLPKLTYRRYIQRPLSIYNSAKARETAKQPGIILRNRDMVGDQQMFDHCCRVLRIKASADKSHDDKVSIDLRLIPFLPNCPSVLLVDNQEMQFTIPTRIDQPGDRYAELGLLGVLVMEDHARGAKVCDPFVTLFNRLRDFSVFVRDIETDAVLIGEDGGSGRPGTEHNIDFNRE